MSHIKGVIAGRIERLEELIAVHEEIAGEEAIERADAASFDPGPEAERLRRSQAAKSRELRQTLELFLKMQAAREKRKTSTTEGTEGTEGRERRDQECANEADSGSRMGWGEAGQGTVEDGARIDHGRHGKHGRDGGRRASGRGGEWEPGGRDRRAGRRRADDSRPEENHGAGSGGRFGGGVWRGKKGASEANLEMIKQLMAQRFSDMPAARGRANEAKLRSPMSVLTGRPASLRTRLRPGIEGGAGMPGPARDSSRRPSPGSQVFGNPLVGVS